MNENDVKPDMSWGQIFSQDAWVGQLTDILSDPKERSLLISKARWLLLVIIGGYGMFAAFFYTHSKYGFFFSAPQVIVLVVSVSTLVIYNTTYMLAYEKIRHFKYADHLQILFDLFLVTIVVYFSGSSSSWLWPIYLIITVEAAVLLEDSKEVWQLGALGGLLYGSLLLFEYMDILKGVPMPFVDNALHHNGLYMALNWCWVSLLNALMAIISAFLMGIIRNENVAVRKSRAQLVDFIGSANDLIFCMDKNTDILLANQAWERAIGIGPSYDTATTLTDLLSPSYRTRIHSDIDRLEPGESGIHFETDLVSSATGRKVSVEGNLTAANGPNGTPVIWGILRDITQKKKDEARLQFMANHDLLTGLPNRSLFMDRLRHSMDQADRRHESLAVMFLDVDRFKMINDTLGHHIGDHVLQMVGQRLGSEMRAMDTLARIGGDEFMMVIPELHSPDDAATVGGKLLKSFSHPFIVEGHELYLTASIGIALYPEHTTHAEELTKMADLTMYHAKSLGRNNFQFFHSELNNEAENRLNIVNGIRQALENDEFLVYYQPKVDTETGHITGLEALLRWKHPIRGIVLPEEFIWMAEETGLIVPIGEWVLRKVCEHNREWAEQGMAPLRIAVNLSGIQLQQGDLVDTIQQILHETDTHPSVLELEITESVIMQNPCYAEALLRRLYDLGICISIDDFGTGYSSLSHLKRFSVQTLKIDKSFVQDAYCNAADAAIASAIISIGRNLNMTVIAEGVETEDQLNFFRQKQCNEIQGFFFSHPVPSDQVLPLTRQRGTRH